LADGPAAVSLAAFTVHVNAIAAKSTIHFQASLM
jgi:hypothetical protein